MNNLQRGDIVVATYGYNNILKKPFRFLYEFGYYTKYGCVVYNRGECNMQDAHAFTLDQIKLAEPNEIAELYYGH